MPPDDTDDTATGEASGRTCPTRQVLDRLGNRWAVLILLLLEHETLRFNVLQRRIGGISQKMLSRTLKDLERDGLVDRHVRATSPVTVEYASTDLARGLIAHLTGLRDWSERHVAAIDAARAAYDDAAG